MTRIAKTLVGTTPVLICVVTLTALAGCGEDFENRPPAPAAVELTGVIQAKTVTVSPDAVGAGPVRITISNQTDSAHTVTLEGKSVRERVGPVNAQDTATLQKTLPPGKYEVRAGSEQAVAREIAPAELTVGPPRGESNGRTPLP